MKNLWKYISALLAGALLGMVLMFEMAKKSISNISIKKQVQKNKGNDNTQQYSVDKNEDKKEKVKLRDRKLFNLKRKRNG